MRTASEITHQLFALPCAGSSMGETHNQLRVVGIGNGRKQVVIIWQLVCLAKRRNFSRLAVAKQSQAEVIDYRFEVGCSCSVGGSSLSFIRRKGSKLGPAEVIPARPV